jgi:hypothetical protein
MDRAKAIDKIRKCMRLARSANPHEAAAALRQAQALMREFGIEDADLLAAEAAESRAKSRAAANPVDWEVMLANLVAECFGCEIVFRGGVSASIWRHGRVGEYAFIGAGVRAEIAAYAFEVLLRQAAKARERYIRKELARCKPASKTRRADEFCRFWIVAVRKKVNALVPSSAEQAAVAAFKGKHYPQTVTHKGRERGTGRIEDKILGFEAGENAQLHHGVDRTEAPQLEHREPV